MKGLTVKLSMEFKEDIINIGIMTEYEGVKCELNGNVDSLDDDSSFNDMQDDFKKALSDTYGTEKSEEIYNEIVYKF